MDPTHSTEALAKQFKTVKSRQMAYHEQGEGQPVVFLHGNSMSSESFAAQLEDPALKAYRLIAVDLPRPAKAHWWR